MHIEQCWEDLLPNSSVIIIIAFHLLVTTVLRGGHCAQCRDEEAEAGGGWPP